MLLYLSAHVPFIVMAEHFNSTLLYTNSIVSLEYDLLVEFRLFQNVEDPAHVSGSSANSIDHIVTTSSVVFSNTYIYIKLLKLMIIITYNV